ncbi:unnamed protein product [Brassica oleracea]
MLLDKSWIFMGFKRFKLWGKRKTTFNFVCVTAWNCPREYLCSIFDAYDYLHNRYKYLEFYFEIKLLWKNHFSNFGQILNSFVVNSLCIVVHTYVIGQVVDLHGVQTVQVMGKEKNNVQFRLRDCILVALSLVAAKYQNRCYKNILLKKKNHFCTSVHTTSSSQLLFFFGQILNSFVVNSLCIVVHTYVIGQVVDLHGVQTVQVMGKEKNNVQFRLRDCM